MVLKSLLSHLYCKYHIMFWEGIMPAMHYNIKENHLYWYDPSKNNQALQRYWYDPSKSKQALRRISLKQCRWIAQRRLSSLVAELLFDATNPFRLYLFSKREKANSEKDLPFAVEGNNSA